MAQQNKGGFNNNRNSYSKRNESQQFRQEEEIKVTSPYNFVPLNKNVFFPEWGPLVSHDVPFENGLSGSFDVEIEAMSPIYIRGTQINGDKFYTNKDGEKISTEFMHFNDIDDKPKYFIPGSSFRNMIRSVVEIIGFGKMERVDNNKSDKIPYGINGPISFIQKEVINKKLDLAQAIFGDVVTLRKEKKNFHEKYKSRVFVSHAFCISNPVKTSNAVEVILGTPKPTFYPYYLEQNIIDSNGNINGNFKKWNYNSKIAGRKRYPIHNSFSFEEIENNKKNVSTHFLPLEKGTRFLTKIHYHNLKSEELGALLSAITFHGQSMEYFHNIGMAKPYGFGKIKVKILNLENDKIDKHLGDFEYCMNTHTKDWLHCPQVKELLSMAKNDPNQDRKKLKYPALKSFAKIKEQKMALPRYSEFMNIHIEKNTKIYTEKYNYKQIESEQDLKMFDQNTVENALGGFDPQNLEINLEDIKINETEIDFKILNMTFPKKAQIQFNGELLECQFTIPKHIDSTPFQIGTIQKGIITHINLEKKLISQLKIID